MTRTRALLFLAVALAAPLLAKADHALWFLLWAALLAVAAGRLWRASERRR